ncbi:MAG: hypothetical protein Q4C03_02985 [bacterium]|nr:hypothetical protein [bacterium]
MKITLLFILLTSIGVTHASATVTTKWATGVSETEGWYDVNKTKEKDVDDYMCYAASAANIIAWWQKESNLISNAPKEATSIWDTYKNACLTPQIGGDPIAAMNWWVSGVYLPMSSEQVPRSYYYTHPENIETLRTFDGYYYDEYGLTRSDLQNLFEPLTSYRDSYFGMLLEQGAGVSLTIAADDGPLAHAITLWGAEYTDGSLSKIWVTDSDDYKDELIPVDVFTDTVTGKLYFDHSEGANIGYYRNVVDTKGNPIDQIYVSGLYTLNAFVTDDWQLLAPIPEPTTPTLSLLALAALAARRRRNAS